MYTINEIYTKMIKVMGYPANIVLVLRLAVEMQQDDVA